MQAIVAENKYSILEKLLNFERDLKWKGRERDGGALIFVLQWPKNCEHS